MASEMARSQVAGVPSGSGGVKWGVRAGDAGRGCRPCCLTRLWSRLARLCVRLDGGSGPRGDLRLDASGGPRPRRARRPRRQRRGPPGARGSRRARRRSAGRPPDPPRVARGRGERSGSEPVERSTRDPVDSMSAPATAATDGGGRTRGDEPARFDEVTTGRAAIFTGGRPVHLPDHRNGWRWEPYAVDGIVALAEAHDSGIADDRRRDIAADLDNLTIADPQVNRTEKSDRDAGEWTPARHGAWFAERVIAVKLEYELSVDPRERDALEALLAAGGAQLSCVGADTTSPTVAISSDAGAPVTGPFSITVAFSEPVTGFELEDLVVGNGSASELQGNNASYMAAITPAASGTVTVDIAAGAAQDGAGNPSAAAVQFSIVADLTPVPALPVIGALALALLLLGGGARRRTAS